MVLYARFATLAICAFSWTGVATLGVGGDSAQAPRVIEQNGTGIARLDFLIGTWHTRDSIVAGTFGLKVPATGSGTIRYQRSAGGTVLVYDFETSLSGFGPYFLHGVVAVEPGTGVYKAFIANNLGNALTYDGTWLDDSTLSFDLTGIPGRSARVTYVRHRDGISLSSSRPTPTGSLETYFSTRLTR